MTPSLSTLRSLAEAATPGPREAYNDNEGMEPQFNPLWCVANEEYHNPTSDDAQCFEATVYSGTKADAAFIAACSPEVILALIAEVEAARHATR